jgi:hypothetical protein
VTEKRRFRLKPNVHFHGVQWFRDEGVFMGKVVADRVGMIRLLAPQGAPEPTYIDVPSYWVEPTKD